MAYYLGTKSLKNLKGVRPDLVELVKETIKISPVDFTIIYNGGLRTASMQMKLYKEGASKINGRTVKSKHQKQDDGFGWAVDLVPYISGGPRWEWPPIYKIAGCMAYKAVEMDIDLRWGGVWDKPMDDYAPKSLNSPEAFSAAMEREVRKYCVRHPGPDFIDGPHYELLR